MFKKLLPLIFVSLLASVSWGQTQGITGMVTSETDGKPLAGATIVVEGTNTAAITNEAGRFTINAKADAVLSISYIGYITQSVPVGVRSVVDVALAEEIRMLDQVVVTGYSTQRRADLTGAVAVVDMDDVYKSSENNAMKALQGRVAGLNIIADGNPGGKVSIQIRGVSNLADDTTPLYVIDGIPTQGGMHELNPNDIESIQVLKDASSASIYGSRAANGVVVVTTKQGKAGSVKVSFDAYATMSWYNNRIQMLNSREYGKAMWQAMVNSGLDPNTANSIGYRYDWGYDTSGNPVLNGITVPKFIDAGGLMPSSDTDWFDQISRMGVAQNYNLSVSGGTECMKSQFSLNYYDNEGTLKYTDFNRFSARMNTRYKVWGDIITIGENFSVNRVSEVEANTDGVLDQAMQSLPLVPVYKTDGNWGGPSAGMNDRHNPLRLLDANKDNRYTYWRMFGNAFIDVQPINNLVFRSNFGLDYGNFYRRQFTRSFVSGEKWDEDLTASELQQRHWMKWTWSNTLSYGFEIKKHRFDALIGMEAYKQDDIEFSAYKEDYELETTDYMWPDAGTGSAMAYGNGDGYSLLSYFAKVNYVYADKYLVSVTVRRDGSSKFGDNNPWGTFPAFSAGWRISEEGFMERARGVVSDLKLRAGWGQTGNQNHISNTASYALYAADYGGSGNDAGGSTGTAYDITGKGSGQLGSGFRKTRSGNADLKWETSTQINAGLDFSLFKYRLYGSFDYYVKNTEGMLAMVSYPAASGEGSRHWANGASMRNQGFEILIGWRDRTSFGFEYDITGNLSRNRNKVTTLPESLRSTYGGNGSDDTVEGRSLFSHYGYIADGIFKTQEEVDAHAGQTGKGLGRIRYRDTDGNGSVGEEDRTWLGTSEPDFMYGLNINLAWKGFDLSAFFQGVQGGLVYNSIKMHTDFWGVDNTGSNKGVRLLDAWSPTNMDSDIPAMSYNDNNNEKRFSTYYLEKQSFFKLRNLQLGYTIPQHLTQKIRIERLRIYLSGQNLFMVKSKGYTGPDPENPSWGYPIPATFTVGLNISF